MYRRFLSDQNFPKFAVGVVAGFSFVGLMALRLVQSPSKNTNEQTVEMTRDEAMLRAMIENAKFSSWQENIENVAMAQGRFMLPGSSSDKNREESFLRDISKRSDEMMEQEEARKREEKERVEIFSTTWKRN